MAHAFGVFRSDDGLRCAVTSIDRHRNGCCGTPFFVVLFWFRLDGATHRMVATVFPEAGNIAVLDTDMANRGNVRFAENSWRGDVFEDGLRVACQRYEDAICLTSAVSA